jgi:O-antigen/teichoic acid export membrane protein
MQHLYNIGSLLVFISSLLITCLLLIFHQQLLRYFGESFVVGAPTLFVLAFTFAINTSFGVAWYFLSLGGKQKELLTLMKVLLILHLAISIPLIRYFDYQGAAIGILLTRLIFTVLVVILARRYFKLKVLFII